VHLPRGLLLVRLADVAASAWGLAPAERRRTLRHLPCHGGALRGHAAVMQGHSSPGTGSFPSLPSLPLSAVSSLAVSSCLLRGRRGRRCRVRGCGEEGVLVTDRARAHLEACRISACRVPALDASLRSHARVVDCGFSGCVGAQSVHFRRNI